jgi:hypothetical protein
MFPESEGLQTIERHSDLSSIRTLITLAGGGAAGEAPLPCGPKCVRNGEKVDGVVGPRQAHL